MREEYELEVLEQYNIEVKGTRSDAAEGDEDISAACPLII